MIFATSTAREVLDFWFGAPLQTRRKAWFEKDPAFDAEIRARFLRLHCAATRGELAAWSDSAHGALALIVLTDQLPRNMYRGTAAAFASDPRALEVAQAAVAAGFDRTLAPTQRWFMYLPFEHSEDRAIQMQSLALFETLGDAKALDYARQHKVIIDRFGRYPHRNAILGRTSTPEEVAFLAEPNSSF